MKDEEIVDFEHFFLPTLSHFENGNGWKSSLGLMRFELAPLPADGKEPPRQLHASVWYGPFCQELSRVEAEADFSPDEDGLQKAADWLRALGDEMNRHPRRTWEECLAYRDEAKKRQKAEETA